MTKYSLRARMMILILAPTLMVGLLLSSFFVVHRYNELQRQVIDAGANIIEPLAISSEYSMTWHNRDAMRELVSLLHRRHSGIVRAISVFDNHNQLYVTSNHKQNLSLLQQDDIRALPDDVSMERHGSLLILRTPITSERYDVDELPDEDAKPAGNPLGYVAIELDLQSVRLQQYKEVFVATLMLLFCLCLAMLFAYRLMRDVTGPIRNMVTTVDRIRRGQLDSRVEGYMLGELNILKNGINAMAMSLTAYHEEMQHNIDQATYDLRETLEQLEIQNVELDLAKKRAQEAARIKSEFLANMSHELRTPLNGVLGFTRQMLKTQLRTTQRDYMQTIERSANNLLSIINDVLDFSKLEAGKLMLEAIPFPLRATLDETLVLLAPSAHEKGLELTVVCDSSVPDNVIGDALRLQQILINLIGNAIKFTEKGYIGLRVGQRVITQSRVELEIQVEDSGIGISEQQQTQLFQAFRQADASISRRHGGTGLGLVITQKLVREMGGEITFSSQPDQGSTFMIRVQLDLNPNAPGMPRVLETLSQARIAYVEADANVASAALEMLSATPLQIDYSETLEGLKASHYPLLLMAMPVGISQPELLNERLINGLLDRADNVLMALPSPMMLLADELKVRGIDGCIAKPISLTRLLPMLLDIHTRQVSELPLSPRLPLTVMAVDDNPANLKLIGALLEEQVQNILLCSSAEHAIREARQQSLDVILMDIQMPEIDGIRASEIIRGLPHHANTPIVAVTAHAIDGEREQLIKAGMNDYLAKPIDESKLRQLLARYTPPPVVSLPELQPILPTLDWQLALRQAANKPELARDLLRMLLEFLPEVHAKMAQFMTTNEVNALREIIHKLHGSASYSGVPRMKQLCHQLERGLLEASDIAALEPELLELQDEMENVAREARRLLGFGEV
ncbi:MULTISPECIES: two-component sensor histidine kinase BarA [Pantoea]|jgi:two-component system sensor histidine kinase BarA|uniref:histidine kinase n=1 Tax=Pantoea vagans TaxID=470934 RepID=A0AAN1TWW1_9GAMM|nr:MULTISPECIES: two-component sensor histidine kinase BarA [Pantoea]ADO10627.1 hybrid sensory histidine kinase [Pantoea vagans C9-1]AVV38901.1 two-component sensor histidine kinase BarA [Pantoea vagans]MBK5017043.1 two-component sensor histidine kinase BarA [Pantoea sp. S62]PAW35570.1 two-component sensor histidine kinase BarA [Pantoea vagans]PXW19799.1 two-component system sensor histidine kinase BarA [Pantoea sp. JKS000250]